MRTYFVLLLLVLFLVVSSTTGQEMAHGGTFCYAYANQRIAWDTTQEAGGLVIIESDFRIFLLGELTTDTGEWVKVRYRDRFGYMRDPLCWSMEDLHAEVDPYLEDGLRRINHDPTDHEAYAFVAQAYITLGDYDRAIEYIQQALSLEPRNVSYNGILGTAYSETNRMDEFMQYIIPDIELEPDWYLPGRGAENVEDNGFDVYTHGQWLVLRLANRTLIAVPEGWMMDDDMFALIAFYPEGNTDVETGMSLAIQIFGDVNFENLSSEEMMERIFDESDYSDTDIILDRAVIDEYTGYVFVHLTDADPDAGIFPYVLLTYALEPTGTYRTYAIYARDETVWTNFYPLVQAILAHVRTRDLIPVGVDLPDSLGMLPHN